MAKFYAPFLLYYGIVHIIGGVVLWGYPAATGAFLLEPLPPSMPPLLGFLSILSGLGFVAAAGVTQPASQKIAIVCCIVGNVVNLAAHLQNVARGYATTSLAVAGTLTVAAFIAILVAIYRGIDQKSN